TRPGAGNLRAYPQAPRRQRREPGEVAADARRALAPRSRAGGIPGQRTGRRVAETRVSPAVRRARGERGVRGRRGSRKRRLAARGSMARARLTLPGTMLLAMAMALGGPGLRTASFGDEASPPKPDGGPVSRLRVPDGFVVELVAAPPLVEHP